MRAWATMFEEFLSSRGVEAPYTEADYFEHVDGRPRYDGVRAVLASRGLELPEGEDSDPGEQSAGEETVRGLGNRKNELVLELLRRDGEVALWSRGEERLDGRFPEIEAAAMALPDGTVLDGELLAWRADDDAPLPFTALQTRIQRLKPGPKTLADTPVRLQVYDLLERDGDDWRAKPQHTRRAALETLIDAHDDPRIVVSPRVEVPDWAAAADLRAQARERGVEGLMLKRAEAPYQTGRRRGDWWKWKIDPLTIDAVLLYAQAGHGRRSTLYTDYTFGLWDGEVLVPVAKAYSGLDDREILQLDRWIRANTLERFGPVRSVTAHHVFELGFEAVNRSSRHKSGIAVRFPRILRWRHDKPVAEADRLETLKALAR